MTSPSSATIAHLEFLKFLARHRDFHDMYLTDSTPRAFINNIRDTMRAVELATYDGLRILNDELVTVLCRAVYEGIYNEWVDAERRMKIISENVRVKKYGQHEGEM